MEMAYQNAQLELGWAHMVRRDPSVIWMIRNRENLSLSEMLSPS